MNRRTLLQTAGATGSLAVAGCLETDTGSSPEPPTEERPGRYSLPSYSNWPPTTSHDGNGAVVSQLALSPLPAISQAVSGGRLQSSQPFVGLPLLSIDRITTAVESVSSNPFAAVSGESPVDSLFESVASFISTLSVTVDDAQRLTAAEARFSGLFPAGPPTAEAIRSSLGAVDDRIVFHDLPRAHVTAAFSEL